MESFYGGRQGASFIIVKKFDGIDIPQEGDGSGVIGYTYTGDEYAVNDGGDFLVVTEEESGTVKVGSGSYIIARNHDNYNKYNWAYHVNDGSSVNDNEEYTFPKVLAEGMKQHFAQGALTSSEVNYGEYVIIDTIANLHQQNDPDNGKVFRRGFDIDSEYAGGEYIGQIVGPQGESPELEIDTYETVTAQDLHQERAYDVNNQGLIAGYDGDETFVDDIKYAWVTIRDSYGNVQGCLIGFQIPYLVEEIQAHSISAYEHRTTDENGAYIYTDLIERVDDKDHPFYEKWDLKVPKGIKGDTISNLLVVTAEAPKGEPGDVDYKPGDGVEAYTGQNEERVGSKQILVYNSTNYDDSAAGTTKTYKAGNYNVLDENSTEDPIVVEDDGSVKIHYTYSEDSVYPQIIRQIDNIAVDTGEPEGTGSQKIVVTYNQYIPGTDTNQTAEIGNPINYIMALKTTDDYHLLAYHSDPARREKYAEEYKKDGWQDLGSYKDDGGVLVGMNLNASEIGLTTNTDIIKYLNDTYSEGLTDGTLKGKIITIGSVDEDVESKTFYAFDYNTNSEGKYLGWYPLGKLTVNADSIMTIGDAGNQDAENVQDLPLHGIWFVINDKNLIEAVNYKTDVSSNTFSTYPIGAIGDNVYVNNLAKVDVTNEDYDQILGEDDTISLETTLKALKRQDLTAANQIAELNKIMGDSTQLGEGINSLLDLIKKNQATFEKTQKINRVTVNTANWSESENGIFFQTITLEEGSEITEDSVPEVFLDYRNIQDKDMADYIEQYGYIANIITGAGSITLYAYDRPTLDIYLILKGV